MSGARYHQGRHVPLPSRLQQPFARLRASHGCERLASVLGCSTVTVSQLEFGGRASPATVARVAAALERLTTTVTKESAA